MLQKSMWWVGLLMFALLVGGIHSLGFWVRPVPTATKAAPSAHNAAATAAAQRHVQCQPNHWRAMIMQQ